MNQHRIEPCLDYRGYVVPVQRELQNYGVVLAQQLLLARDIDVEIGVGLIEVVDGAAFKSSISGEPGGVGAGVREVRVGERRGRLVVTDGSILV